MSESVKKKSLLTSEEEFSENRNEETSWRDKINTLMFHMFQSATAECYFQWHFETDWWLNFLLEQPIKVGSKQPVSKSNPYPQT